MRNCLKEFPEKVTNDGVKVNNDYKEKGPFKKSSDGKNDSFLAPAHTFSLAAV